MRDFLNKGVATCLSNGVGGAGGGAADLASRGGRHPLIQFATSLSTPFSSSRLPYRPPYPVRDSLDYLGGAGGGTADLVSRRDAEGSHKTTGLRPP